MEAASQNSRKVLKVKAAEHEATKKMSRAERIRRMRRGQKEVVHRLIRCDQSAVWSGGGGQNTDIKHKLRVLEYDGGVKTDGHNNLFRSSGRVGRWGGGGGVFLF